MAHWTHVLSNVSLAEYVLLAVLTTFQWTRHRQRGAAWLALAFVILGGVSLTLKVDPASFGHEYVAKVLLALLLVLPYLLFRFTGTIRATARPVELLAGALTAGIVVYTFALGALPGDGRPTPPHFVAYRIAVLVAIGFVCVAVVAALLLACRGEPRVAAARMRLLALAVAGLELQVIIAALALRGATVDLVTEALTATVGALFLAALVFPSFVRLYVTGHEDVVFRDAVSELVSAGDSHEVAARLLPHVRALVGARRAALLASDGTMVASDPAWVDETGPEAGGGRRDGTGQRRITVRTRSGATHLLVVQVSPAMAYFGSEELRQLEQLADMVGLAIERSEMAEQMAFQASHDALTGLANRALFMERLDDALRHVGRRRSSLAVLFIDLDRFKLVNDRADHAAGDLVLKEMADRLTAMTRGVDLVARFGGDEFVALAEVAHHRDAMDMAERIRVGLRVPVATTGGALVVTASVGVVVTDDGSTSAAALLRDADNAMYEAKRSGRDLVVLSSGHARDLASRAWGLTPARARRLSAG